MNKFLPFITNESSAFQIFKTLSNKSSEVSNRLLFKVFCAVISAGIENVQEYVKSLEKLNTKDLYDRIANHYPVTSSADTVASIILSMPAEIPVEQFQLKDSRLEELRYTQMVMFLAGISFAKGEELRSEYSDIPFEKLCDNNLVSNALNDLPSHTNFSSSGTPMYFTDSQELMSYILCTSLLGLGKTDEPVYATFTNPDENDILTAKVSDDTRESEVAAPWERTKP